MSSSKGFSHLTQEALDAEIGRLEAIRALSATEGWKILKDALERILERLKGTLETVSHKDLIRTQAKVETLRLIIEQPEHFLQELEELETEKEERVVKEKRTESIYLKIHNLYNPSPLHKS